MTSSGVFTLDLQQLEPGCTKQSQHVSPDVYQCILPFTVFLCCILSTLIFTDRIRRMGEGNVFSLSTGEGGGGTPRYLPPVKVRIEEGYPKVPTPWPRGTYPPCRSGWGRGYLKVPTPWPRYLPFHTGQDGGVPQGTYPPPPPHPGQDT